MNRSYLPPTQYLLTAVAAVLGLLLLFGGAVMFGVISAATTNRIATRIPATPQLVQSAAGSLLIGVGLYYMRTGEQNRNTSTQLTSTDSPPEQPQSPPKLVGEKLDATLEDSRDAVRLKQIEYTQTEAHELLYETAQTAITVTQACSASEADRLLDTGEWTTNTVAQAFLSNTQSYPITFQFIRWATPGTAYEIAIEQTVHAINTMLTKSRSQDAEQATDIDVAEPLRSVIDDIRAAIDTQRRAVSAGKLESTTAAGTTSQATDDQATVSTKTTGQTGTKEDN